MEACCAEPQEETLESLGLFVSHEAQRWQPITGSCLGDADLQRINTSVCVRVLCIYLCALKCVYLFLCVWVYIFACICVNNL